VVMAVSMAERDGAMLVVGWIIFAITIAFFATIFLGGAEIALWLKEYFAGFFDPQDEAPGVIP